uniref:Uncharacterized protein n=1 Tax=Proboscia inermis TaxID=420281 RepID=A0A7S0GL35_9STRA
MEYTRQPTTCIPNLYLKGQNMVTCSIVGAMVGGGGEAFNHLPVLNWLLGLSWLEMSNFTVWVILGKGSLQNHQRIKKDQFCEIINMVPIHIIFFWGQDFGYSIQ